MPKICSCRLAAWVALWFEQRFGDPATGAACKNHKGTQEIPGKPHHGSTPGTFLLCARSMFTTPYLRTCFPLLRSEHLREGTESWLCFCSIFLRRQKTCLNHLYVVVDVHRRSHYTFNLRDLAKARIGQLYVVNDLSSREITRSTRAFAFAAKNPFPLRMTSSNAGCMNVSEFSRQMISSRREKTRAFTCKIEAAFW